MLRERRVQRKRKLQRQSKFKNGLKTTTRGAETDKMEKAKAERGKIISTIALLRAFVHKEA